MKEDGTCYGLGVWEALGEDFLVAQGFLSCVSGCGTDADQCANVLAVSNVCCQLGVVKRQLPHARTLISNRRSG